MSVTLESLASCWQGLIPATLYTCSLDGIPNAAYLSHVDYVDSTHVALSFQFFNKSRRNIAENPNALVRVIDPDTSQSWALRLRLVRSETSGPVFERMALRIEAIASYTGLKGIFKLIAADIYEVRSIEPTTDDVAGTFARQAEARCGASEDPRFTMRAMQDLAVRINQAEGLDDLLDSILAGLDDLYGFHHSMILVPAEEQGVLVTLASRGYPENGVGAEARVGEGIIGVVAEARKPIRISGLLRAMLYAHAVAERARRPACARPSASSCPGCRIPRVSWECRCWCATSWWASCASRARTRIASTRRTRPRSSSSATTWRLPSRMRSCRSAPKPPTRVRQRWPPRSQRHRRPFPRGHGAR